MISIKDTLWENAACKGEDTNLFFPEEVKYKTQDKELAKSICKSCSIRVECLLFAISNDESGIWGGTTAAERKELKALARRKSISVTQLMKGTK